MNQCNVLCSESYSQLYLLTSLKVHGISPSGCRTPTVTGVRIYPLGNMNSKLRNNFPMITLASICEGKSVILRILFTVVIASFTHNCKMMLNAFSVTNTKGKEHKSTWSERSKGL